MSGQLILGETSIIAIFEYDPELVAAVKRVPGARWDRAGKAWHIPVERQKEAVAVAVEQHWWVDPAIAAMNAPDPTPVDMLEFDQMVVRLRFGYDQVKVRAVKQIPGVTWDQKSKGWVAPATSLAEAVDWAEKFSIPITEETYSERDRVLHEHGEMLRQSRDVDADIQVADIPLLGYQRAGVAYAAAAKRTFIADDMGLGKFQPVSSPVLTPDGWVRMGDIRTGMMVTGRDGSPTRVLAVYPQGVQPVYRVTFNDGSSTLAGDEHLWSVRTNVAAAREEPWITVTTGQMMRGEIYEHVSEINGRTYRLDLSVKAKNGGRRLQIPMVEPVHYASENNPLPMDPYLFGCWLGDGTTNNGQITSMDDDIVDAFCDAYEPGAWSDKDGSRCVTVTLLGLRAVLREMGVLGNKHIPAVYMRSNPENRLSLLQGLMDTDGSPADCATEFTTVLPVLAEQVAELVQSLGGVARVRTRYPKFVHKGERRVGKLAYRLNIKMPAGMPLFRLQRKIDKYQPASKYPPARYIESIDYSHDEQCQCIAVDAPDHLYITNQFIVTHNTLQAIATLEYLNETVPQYPALVVCPPTLLLNWKNEYGKWLPHRSVSVIRNRKDWPTEQFDVLVVGYSNIKAWENQLQGFRSYVFDESHSLKSPDAQRTKAALKIVKKVPDGGAVLCLTGTPVTNKPAEYAPQLELLGKLKDFGGKMGFYRRYCNAFRDRFGHWNIDGHSNLDELNERLRGNCYVRRTKDQVMTELPKVRHNRLLVEGAPAAMKEYREAEANIVKYLMDRAAQIAVELGEKPGSAAVRAKMRAERNEHLVKIGTLRKLAARAKMNAVVEWVDAAIDSGNKVVVAAHHRDIVDELATRYGNLKIQGQMDVFAVEKAKKVFQEGSVADAPVIVLSIQAAKTGHTLTASQDVLFVELPWTWADVDQTYSRCHRLGQKGSVTATYMLCEGTIDEKIYDVVERKREVVKAAVEGGEMGSAAGDVFDLFLSKI